MDSEFAYDASENAVVGNASSRNGKDFTRCRISASAGAKMIEHAMRGVVTGQNRGGSPIEIMGLLLGKAIGDSVVILDAFPLPVEGTETRVVADDEQVSSYMVSLADQMEKTRQERLIGWYHSHPFDVGSQSNCFLSNTDISTQRLWQTALDPKWVAIVIDPLRTIARQKPELMCFRVYPNSYTPHTLECPDGSAIANESERVTRWGQGFNRYYALQIEWFSSALGRKMLNIVAKDHVWIRSLASTAGSEPEEQIQIANSISTIVNNLENCDINSFMKAQTGLTDSTSKNDDVLSRANHDALQLATKMCEKSVKQMVKQTLFNTNFN